MHAYKLTYNRIGALLCDICEAQFVVIHYQAPWRSQWVCSSFTNGKFPRKSWLRFQDEQQDSALDDA